MSKEEIQPGKDVDVTVSPCKGNFTIISPGSTQSTAKVTNFNGKTLSLKYSYEKDNPNFPLYLNPNNEHFVNFRWKRAEYDTRFGTGYFQAKFYYERVSGTGRDQPTCTDQPVTQYFIDQPVGAVGLKNDQVLSIQFPSTKLLDGVEHVTNFQFSFPIPSNPQATNYEYCISECRGSFVAVNNTKCKGNVSIAGTDIFNSIPNTIVPEYYGTTCVLEKNKNYYLNVRTKDPATGANTCSDPAGCSLSVSLLYYRPQYTPAGGQSTVMTSCASFSGRIIKWEGSQVKITPFTNSSTVAIEIDTEKYPLLNNSKSYAIGFVATSDTTRYAEVEASISNCPGDFNAKETFGSRCGAHAFPPGSMRVSLGTSNQAYTVCELPVSTKKIYVNFRLRKTDGSGSGSCEVDSCPLWVNISR